MTDEDRKALSTLMVQLVYVMRIWRAAVMSSDDATALTAATKSWALLSDIDDLTINIERDEATIQ